MRTHMCTDMRTDMHRDTRADMRMEMCIVTCTGMCTDTRIDMCVHICMGMCIGAYNNVPCARAKFDKDARFMAKYFEAYPLLDAKTIKGLNIFAVHQELDNDTGSNCHYGCQGIDRSCVRARGYAHVHTRLMHVHMHASTNMTTRMRMDVSTLTSVHTFMHQQQAAVLRQREVPRACAGFLRLGLLHSDPGYPQR